MIIKNVMHLLQRDYLRCYWRKSVLLTRAHTLSHENLIRQLWLGSFNVKTLFVRFNYLLVSLLLATASVDARPVSYSGGSTLMLFSNDIKDALYFHYSPTYRYSLGLEVLKHKFFNKEQAYFRGTYLVQRKNTKKSQRNLYLQSGVAPTAIKDYFYGVRGDWETRRLFSGFGYTEFKNSERDYATQNLQLGVAPYIGDYGDLHTWIMMKAQHNTLTDRWAIYPILRFFKGDFLIDLGYDRIAQWDLHIIYRF